MSIQDSTYGLIMSSGKQSAASNFVQDMGDKQSFASNFVQNISVGQRSSAGTKPENQFVKLVSEI